MINKESRNSLRKQRHLRTKNKIFGTKECPRLSVFKSNTNIYAQIIDDTTFSTLVSASSLELKLNKVNIETSKKVGEELAKRAKDAKISKIVFDKSGYKYHGCVKALADAAREKGLEF